MTPHGSMPPARSRRTGLIVGLVCACSFSLVMVLVIVGGLVFLLSRSGEQEIATVPLEVEGITTVVPEGWAEIENPTGVGMETLASYESPDTDERLTLVRLEVDLDAQGICETLQDSAKEQGLATESVEVLDPVMVDGVSARHHRWIGYSEQRWQHSDAYCMDHDSGTVFLLAENETDEEATPTPAGELMLEHWRWTD